MELGGLGYLTYVHIFFKYLKPRYLCSEESGENLNAATEIATPIS